MKYFQSIIQGCHFLTVLCQSANTKCSFDEKQLAFRVGICCSAHHISYMQGGEHTGTAMNCKCIERTRSLSFKLMRHFLGSMREPGHQLSAEVGQMTIMRGRRERQMTKGITDQNQRIILVVSSHMPRSDPNTHTH